MVSGGVALLYGFLGYLAGGPEYGIRGLCYCVIPVACIWFADDLGGYTGPWGMSYISRESPEIAVEFMGWVLLLLPIIGVPLVWLLFR
jgi:hypothetical protein